MTKDEEEDDEVDEKMKGIEDDENEISFLWATQT